MGSFKSKSPYKKRILSFSIPFVGFLERDGTSLQNLLRLDIGEIRAGIELTDTNERVTIILGDKISIEEGLVNLDFKIFMSSQTFDDIIQGKADAFALAARAKSKEV